MPRVVVGAKKLLHPFLLCLLAIAAASCICLAQAQHQQMQPIQQPQLRRRLSQQGFPPDGEATNNTATSSAAGASNICHVGGRPPIDRPMHINIR